MTDSIICHFCFYPQSIANHKSAPTGQLDTACIYRNIERYADDLWYFPPLKNIWQQQQQQNTAG